MSLKILASGAGGEWPPRCLAPRTALKLLEDGELKIWVQSFGFLSVLYSLVKMTSYPEDQRNWVHHAGSWQGVIYLHFLFFFLLPKIYKPNGGLCFHWAQENVWNISCFPFISTLNMHLSIYSFKKNKSFFLVWFDNLELLQIENIFMV